MIKEVYVLTTVETTVVGSRVVVGSGVITIYEVVRRVEGGCVTMGKKGVSVKVVMTVDGSGASWVWVRISVIVDKA